MSRYINKIFIHEGRVKSYHFKITHKGNVTKKVDSDEVVKLVKYNDSNSLHIYNECNDTELYQKAVEKIQKDFANCQLIVIE